MGTEGIGIGDAARRSGFTREQIVYIDECAYLGEVRRVRETRRFSEEQVSLLERMSALRRLGIRLEDAAALAGARGSTLSGDVERLLAIASAKAGEIEQGLRAWIYLCSLIHQTVAATRGWSQPSGAHDRFER